MLSYNKLRLTIKVSNSNFNFESGLTIGSAFDIDRRDFLVAAENMLKRMMSTDQARITIKIPDGMIMVNDKNEEV